jgi:serine/threonine-protein kinase HipA
MVVKVNLWGQTVGYVAWDKERQIGKFEYEPEFITSKLNISPLQMPLGTKIYEFPNLKRETYKGLPGMLADTLPDDFGNAVVDSWLLRNNKNISEITSVDRLCYVGKRGMGALEYEPIYHNTTSAIPVDVASMVELAQDILNERNQLDTNISEDKQEALETIIKVGTSAGGARPKAIIAYNEKTGEVLSGQSNAPEGFNHYLIKFDGVSDKNLGDPLGYGRVEYAYYKMAIDSGVNMSKCSYLEEEERFHFMTKRFDRIGGSEKVHMQTLCGMAHMDYKEPTAYSYEQAFEVMRKLRLPYKDAEQMFSRMCFNVISKNLDDHTKNVSFLMNKQGRWHLAPAYDITYCYNPKSFWVSQHQMSVNGKRKNITDSDLLAVAKSMNVKMPKIIIAKIKEVVSNWQKYAKEVGVSKPLMEEISRAHNLVNKKYYNGHISDNSKQEPGVEKAKKNDGFKS